MVPEILVPKVKLQKIATKLFHSAVKSLSLASNGPKTLLSASQIMKLIFEPGPSSLSTLLSSHRAVYIIDISRFAKLAPNPRIVAASQTLMGLKWAAKIPEKNAAA